MTNTLSAVADPLAYFITWSCYGTWLHGDEGGSVDRAHNVPGTPYLDPDPARYRRESQRSRQGAFTLDDSARRIVHDSILAHCHHRAWELKALNVRTNHVHVVVDGPASPERAMLEFKAWATRRLREAGRIPRNRRAWTDHGSTRYLWKPEDVAEAIHYVTDCQGPDLD
jgi:REP element-mobilizing transposase RayT